MVKWRHETDQTIKWVDQVRVCMLELTEVLEKDYKPKHDMKNFMTGQEVLQESWRTYEIAPM